MNRNGFKYELNAIYLIVSLAEHRSTMRYGLFLLSLLLALALGACYERPPRTDPEADHAWAAEPGPNPMRERTLEQGEPR